MATMTKSEALFHIARAAYEAATQVGPEHEEEFINLAQDLDVQATDAREEEGPR
jgi:hypothetical protein